MTTEPKNISFPKKPLMARIAWVNVIYLALTPIGTAILLPIYFIYEPFSWSIILFSFLFSSATIYAITGGYHRYFSHLSYEANQIVKLFYLLVGAAAFQGTALKWATDHRRHHRCVDTIDDPYNINQGFLYAHMGWLMLEDNPKYANQEAPDLAQDPLVAFQSRHYFLLAVLMGFGFPTLVGWYLGSALGGLAIGGGLRLVVTNHSTFFINSLCHVLGRQPYTDENTARDSLIMAVLASGEGYHNFHHKFQSDYRNGVRWYQWDPTKWSIWFLERIGWAWNVKRTPSSVILKARLEMEQKRLVQIGIPVEKISPFRERVEEAQKRWRELKEDYEQKKRDVQHRSREKLDQIRIDLKRSKREFHMAWQVWVAQKKRVRLAYSTA